MAKRLIPPPLNRALIHKIVSPSKTSMLDSEIVAAVGLGSHDEEGKLSAVSLNEGDTSMYPEYGGSEIKHGEKNPTSNQRRRLAHSSVNYVVMQYLLCTKNAIRPPLSSQTFKRTGGRTIYGCAFLVES